MDRSDKEFLIVFSLFFSALGVLFSPYWLSGLVAIIILARRPLMIIPFYKCWMSLGLLLAKVTGPVIIRLLYYVILSPCFLIKLFGALEYGRGAGFIAPDNRSSYIDETNFNNTRGF